VAAGIVAVMLLFVPITNMNLAGHVLGGALAAIIGFNVAMLPLDPQHDWPRTVIEEIANEKNPVRLARRVLRHRAVTAMGLTGNDRMGEAESNIPQGMIKFAAKHPVCSLATLDGDQPRVRNVLMWRVDETGFYFLLFSNKKVSEQIKAHPKVEICFFNNPTFLTKAQQMRLTGRMDLLVSEEWRVKAREQHPLWRKTAGANGAAKVEVYRFSPSEAHIWSMGAGRYKVEKDQTAMA